jgi:hypothetical protein
MHVPKCMHRALSFLLLLGTSSSIAFANDGYWSSTGAAFPFKKRHHSIQMMAEDIRIHLNDKNARVEVLFTFKNHGKATAVTMGFPEEGYNGPERTIHGFRSWVDGAPVKVKRRKLRPQDEAEMGWRAAYLKDVKFGAGQTRKVRVSYTGDYGGDVSGKGNLSYVLRTGNSWKGPIGQCRVTVDWSRLKAFAPPELDIDGASPRWRQVGTKRSQAVMRNLRPEADLAVWLTPGFWNFKINGDRVSHHAFSMPKMIRGSATDPLISVTHLGHFFGDFDQEGYFKPWARPELKKVGPLQFDTQALVGSAQMYRLRRDAKLFPHPYDPAEGREEYVYLRDVVAALGGAYQYDAKRAEARIKLKR